MDILSHLMEDVSCILSNTRQSYGKIIAEEPCKDFWNNLLPTGIEQKFCNDTVSAERNVQARVRQTTCDQLSAHTGRTCDTLFNVLGYQCLQSRFVVHSELEKVAKADEVALAKAKLLPNEITDDISYSHWRLSELSKLVNIGSEAAFNSHALDVSSDNLAFFSFRGSS